MSKKVLICGINGQLGSALKKCFQSRYDVYGVGRSEKDEKKYFCCDIAKFKDISQVIDKIQPDIIINTAALAHADRCETEKELAYSINYTGNSNLLRLAKTHDSLYIFISTYYVFDGRLKEYTEDQIPSPLNYYGILKCMSEAQTLSYSKSLVIRAAKIFSVGYDNRNFIARLYNSLKNKEPMSVVDDQFNNPLHADCMAESILTLIEKQKCGIFNLAGEDYVSNYELAVRFAEYFDLDKSLILPIATDKSNQKAVRPMQVKLSLSKLKSNSVKTYTLNQMFDKITVLETPSKDKMISKEIDKDLQKLVSKHLNFDKKEFAPGVSNVPVTGKVFDSAEIISGLKSILDCWWTEGHLTVKFQKKLSKFLGLKHVLPVNSGSSANLVAFTTLTSPLLKEKQLKPGDEVICVAAGFPTTVNPIIQNQCIPVFLDVELKTYNINTDLLETALSDKTKAVFIAHTLGNPFDLKTIREFCDKHNLWLIEDCCDALGSRYDNKLVGTFGDICTFSFYPAHQITAGEGGAVATDNDLLKKIVLSFRDWGRDCHCMPGCDNTCGNRFSQQHGDLPFGYDHKYVYSHCGYNLKWTDMQASIALAQLDKLPDFINKRKHNFKLLKEKLSKFDDKLILPDPTENSDPCWFGFPITTKLNDRKQLINFLESKKIATRLLFGGNLTKQPYFQSMPFRVIGELKNTDLIMEHTFWIGVYPGITDEMIEYISSCFRDYYEKR